jgi:hypothetical protein
MPKDLRKMLRDEKFGTSDLSKNHRKKFESILRIAASFLIVVGLGSSIFFFSTNSVEDTVETAKIESLGSISPELQKIENYYLASIQVELSNLEETPENKELLDSYLEKIGELTSEYKMLTAELNKEGLNEKSINALIDNLQLRLKLLYQLKEQLKDLINTKQNENLQV